MFFLSKAGVISGVGLIRLLIFFSLWSFWGLSLRLTLDRQPRALLAAFFFFCV
jgi:hypothetical protein